MKRYVTTIVFLAGAFCAAAQEDRREVIILRDKEVAHGGDVNIVTHSLHAPMQFISSDFSWDEKIVKGVPYSAEAVTETTQMLVDGNRIARKNSALVYRDGEGRTRREQTIDAVGPWASGQPHKTIFINDPVAGLNYILDPETKTATKITLPKIGAGAQIMVRGKMMTGAGEPGGDVHFEKFVRKDGDMPGDGKIGFTNTPLGKQTIEGVQAEGTRSVTAIPAGTIGNDRPIETVSERWFSNDLQSVVMTKRSDPRMGDTVYKLTNIRRGEPGRTWFEVPGDYTVKEENVMMRKMEKSKKE